VTGERLQAESLGGRLSRLTAIAAAFWLALALPAYWLAGFNGLEGLSIAALLCLVPGLVAISLASLFAGDSHSTSMLTVVLGGMGLRMFFVLVGTMVVNSVRPDLGFRGFIVWLLAFYLAMLLAETLLVVKRDAVEPAKSVTETPET
jgi:hypothetical protein